MSIATRSLRLVPALLILLALPLAAVAGPPSVALSVTGEVPNKLELSLPDIAALKHQSVRVTDEKGNSIEYSGVALAEILLKAGAPLGKGLRGKAMALAVVASAPDGYRVLYSLAEFDPAFSGRTIILADTRDGRPLDSHEGPLRIVVPGDKRGARWVRGVNAITVVVSR